MNKSTETIIRQIIPQGWGFYSKDPRESSLNIYPLTADNKKSIVWPNNRLKNGFGIYRKGRSQGIELGLIVYNLPNDVVWTDCKGDVKNCLENKGDIYPVENNTEIPTICGEYILSYEEEIPWAYANFSQDFLSEAIKVDVKCLKS